MHVLVWPELLARDFRYALRRLGRNPAFTVVACLSLALGIGANTAAFGVLYAVMLRALPVHDPAALVVVSMRSGTGVEARQQYSMTYPAYAYLRDHAASLDGLVAFRDLTVNLSAGPTTERATGMLVSGNYFTLLGVETIAGTPIRAEDDRTPGSGGARGAVAVLSDRLWAHRFGRDAGVIGRSVRVNGIPFTVVGVAPPDFQGTRVGAIPDLYVPMALAKELTTAPNALTGVNNHWIRVIGRLAPGVGQTQAEAEMTVAFRQFTREFVIPAARNEEARRFARSRVIQLESGRAGLSELPRRVAPTLFILMGLVSVVLLLACVNVANLMVARAERYHRDTAIHIALGASGARLWSQTLVESLVLGTGGVLLGILLASWMRGLLGPLVPPDQKLDLSMDRTVLGLSVLLGLAAALFLGLVAGWQSTRRTVIRALKGDDIAARLWLRKTLIVGQLALSVVVLVAAALFGQTLRNLRLVDPGFERERVLILTTDTSAYPREQQPLFYTRLLDEVRAVPGVVSAALADAEPLDYHTFWNLKVKGGPGPHAEPAPVEVGFVSREYFRTMGTPFVRGGDIEPRHTAEARGVIIVNEAFVRAFLQGREPIGTRVPGNGDMVFEIIGVVKDSAANSLRDEIAPMLYRPLEQSGMGRGLVLHVRAAVPPASLASAVQAAVRRAGPDVPVYNVRTIDEQIDRVIGGERTFARLSSTFGVLALLLSAVGLYGVIAYGVSRRTKELGIRLALGAGQRRIVQLVLREAVLLVMLGILIGVPLAYSLGGLIDSVLYGVAPGDWKSLVMSGVVLTMVAVLAAWLPARRAARVDPLIALRYE